MPYSIETKENDAKAYGRGLRISFKNSVKIANRIRKMDLQKAKQFLKDVIEEKRTVDGSRYHPKTCKEILNMLESAESNAEENGLDTENLRIYHISAQKGGKMYRPTRLRYKDGGGPWKMKNCHIEVVLREK